MKSCSLRRVILQSIPLSSPPQRHDLCHPHPLCQSEALIEDTLTEDLLDGRPFNDEYPLMGTQRGLIGLTDRIDKASPLVHHGFGSTTEAWIAIPSARKGVIKTAKSGPTATPKTKHMANHANPAAQCLLYQRPTGPRSRPRMNARKLDFFGARNDLPQWLQNLSAIDQGISCRQNVQLRNKLKRLKWILLCDFPKLPLWFHVFLSFLLFPMCIYSDLKAKRT